MEYAAVETDSGRVAIETRLTPARRFSYIVGEGESCHTAQTRFLDLLKETENRPTLAQIEDAFSVETVTKEFFIQYAELFGQIQVALDKLEAKDKAIAKEFKEKNVSTVDFAKKLMGQIVFLYFLQKKGWLGATKGQDWGAAPHDFLRRLARGDYGDYDNFFNDVLEPLFYDTLATDRGHEAWCKRFKCRIPFLNGGLFETLGDYDWRKTDIILPNRLFTNSDYVEEGITGTGVLDVFDRYNFTVNESEPLEMEVAIDPEMLGKVFENLIEDNRRKGLGAFYTPREIVHYMCQESLINYLETAISKEGGTIPRADIDTFVHLGEQISHYEAVNAKYSIKMPRSIEKNAKVLDDALKDITICDPAVGSGAFPVGMMTEIVRSRATLTPYFNDIGERTAYHFKRHAIQNSLYGVDIDAGAVEIAKLRLWLSLVVDDEDVKQIKPLPNLDYKIVCGNSLLGVDKNLFNERIFRQLEELKPLYFNEPDKHKKDDYKHQIEEIIDDLTDGKEIFDFEIYFSEVFHRKNGFDVVIANPPYIGQKHNNALFQAVKMSVLGKFHQRRMDYFYFFFHSALNLTKPQGIVTFITTNYFLTATYADKLRKDLLERATLRVLINFNELKIFESALGQHNMITVLSNGYDQDALVECRFVNATGFASPDVLRSVLYQLPETIAFSSASNSDIYEGKSLYIRMKSTSSSSEVGDSVFGKISADSQLLDNICDLVEGIHTGADKVSKRHLEKYKLPLEKGAGIYILSESELKQLKLNDEERSLIKPWFKNSDIERWVTKTRHDRFLIYYTTKGNFKKVENIRRHLSQFKPILINRKTRSGTGIISIEDYDEFVSGEKYISYVMNASAFKRGDYFCVSYPREQKVFEGPKIVVPQRSKRNTFAYNTVPWYASADVYFILNKSSDYDLKYLLGLLTSKLFYYWLYHKGKRKGEVLELYIRPLSEIPIKRVSSQKQKPIIGLVDRILATKQRDSKAETSELEREIDRLVYALYDLTSEEITVVEETAHPFA
jgi:type I restriction-modification system DNA methylase subunit